MALQKQNKPVSAQKYVPLTDTEAYPRYPKHNHIYNKLSIAEYQGIQCAPHGIEPPSYPVFSKPIYNLKGLGARSRILNNKSDYKAHYNPAYMWSEVFEGDHYSTDIAVLDGNVKWMCHTHGVKNKDDLFDYWHIKPNYTAAFEPLLKQFIKDKLSDFTGMLNVETIGGNIIEAHLRHARQWQDLYGAGFLAAVEDLILNKNWAPDSTVTNKDAFSVVLWGYAKPKEKPDFITPRRCQISLPYNENIPPKAGQFDKARRLAIINSFDLDRAKKLRTSLKSTFKTVPHYAP